MIFTSKPLSFDAQGMVGVEAAKEMKRSRGGLVCQGRARPPSDKIFGAMWVRP